VISLIVCYDNIACILTVGHHQQEKALNPVVNDQTAIHCFKISQYSTKMYANHRAQHETTSSSPENYSLIQYRNPNTIWPLPHNSVKVVHFSIYVGSSCDVSWQIVLSWLPPVAIGPHANCPHYKPLNYLFIIFLINEANTRSTGVVAIDTNLV
jgi:hypothetical protein